MVPKRKEISPTKIDRRIEVYTKSHIKKSREDFINEIDPHRANTFNSLMNEESFVLVSGYYNLFNFKRFNKMFNANLIHNPKRKDSNLQKFQQYSEEMIAFAKASNWPGSNLILEFSTPKIQNEIFYGWLNKLKPEFVGQTGKKGKQNWWETEKNFKSLIPLEYRWTKAPRLSVKGVTINGVKKPLKRACLYTLACADNNFIIVDLDMRSAHSFIAAKLAGESSLINELIHNKSIWQDKIEEIKNEFPNYITNKNLKDTLKIGVYGTLNGGNPLGDQILDDNIIEGVFGHLDDQQKATTKNIIKIVFKDWKLIESIKRLNELVCTKNDDLNTMHGIDRIKEYKLKERHKLISRYLQGYEVVLLSIISYYILFCGGIVLSLEHDGVVCLFQRKESKSMSDLDVVNEIIQLVSDHLNPWSNMLLGQEIPLEPKLIITNKGIKEY